jgi:hypothetical protein
MTEDIKIEVENLESQDQDEEKMNSKVNGSPDNVVYKKKKPKK